MSDVSVTTRLTLRFAGFLVSVVYAVKDTIPLIRHKTINKFAHRSIIYKDPLESYDPVLGFIYASLFSEEFELLNRIQSQLETKDQDFTSLKLAYVENCKNTGVAVSPCFSRARRCHIDSQIIGCYNRIRGAHGTVTTSRNHEHPLDSSRLLLNQPRGEFTFTLLWNENTGCARQSISPP